MWRILAAALAAGGLLSIALPVDAFHGSPYQLRGTAEFLPTGQVWNAVLDWSGAGGFGAGTFRVTLSDPVSGAKLPSMTIQGTERFTNVHFVNVASCSSLELTGYDAKDTQTQGRMLLLKQGFQNNCLGGERSGDRHMEVTGTLMQHWELVLGTGTAFE